MPLLGVLQGSYKLLIAAAFGEVGKQLHLCCRNVVALIGEPSRKVEPFKLGKECGTVNDGGNIAAKSHGVQTAVPRRSAVAGCPNSFRCS